jgi:exodeoxyribonuclease III
MLKLMSWNVNGIRAVQKKGFLDWLQTEQPDILGLQETKAEASQLDAALIAPPGYQTYWSSSTTRKGYSGVALYSRVKPKSVQTGIGIPEFDDEGRTIVAEYDDFYFITTYVPNGGRDLLRVPYKMQYSDALLAYCNNLREQGKGVIFCGDINTSHKEIDLANPKANRKHTGFLVEECVWMDKLFDEHGYIDTYRKLNPDKTGAYSWWTSIGSARARNVGWRLDYFIISPDLWERVTDAGIHTDIMGSDHCPVSLTLK